MIDYIASETSRKKVLDVLNNVSLSEHLSDQYKKDIDLLKVYVTNDLFDAF